MQSIGGEAELDNLKDSGIPPISSSSGFPLNLLRGYRCNP